MLTNEQLHARTMAIGSSDAAVLAGVENPGKRTWLDLWCEKRRGPNLELDPIVPPSHPPDKPGAVGELWADQLSPLEIGTSFELAVVALYENHTGHKTEICDTAQHPDYPWVRANGDRNVISPDDRGLECKVVGRWMTNMWEADCVPAYVNCQCQWCMACTGRELWDVCAYLGGTEAPVLSVRRDDELIKLLLEAGQLFWEEYVLTDSPPPPADGEDLIRFSGRRWPKDNGEELLLYPPKDDGEPDNGWAEVEATARHLEALQKRAKELEHEVKAEKAKLITLCGEHRAIVGPWGKLSYPTIAGRVSWKRIAEELYGGPVDDETIERHRGAPYRAATLYPFRRK